MRYVKKYGTAGQATDDNIIWNISFACWITTATDTNSEYVILNAFPRQLWLQERASVLRYTYIDCLVHVYCRFIIVAIRTALKKALVSIITRTNMMTICWS
jgi:hypothetical protein